MNSNSLILRIGGRAAAGAVILLLTVLAGVTVSRAGEIVPSVGLTRDVNGSSETQAYGGLAFRGTLTPLFKTEVGVAYRSTSRANDLVKVRQWPLTASLYLTPIPILYAGGGVGWYQTTFDYASSVPLSDETRQDFGVHLGGGLQIPLGAPVALDLGGRYVMMREQDDHLVPQKFDPDFWTTSIGLAFKF